LGNSLKGKHLNEQEKLFAEMFKAVFGAVYLGFNRDFSQAGSWLIKRFLADALEELLNDEDDEENFEDMSLIPIFYEAA